MIHSTVINLHPIEYCQEFQCYPFAVKLNDVFEVVIVLIICLINYVFQTK